MYLKMTVSRLKLLKISSWEPTLWNSEDTPEGCSLKLWNYNSRSTLRLSPTSRPAMAVHKVTERTGWAISTLDNLTELGGAFLFSPGWEPQTHQLQGHSPEGYKILFLLVSTGGHRGCPGSYHLTDTVLPGLWIRPDSSWSTVWPKEGKHQVSQQPVRSPHQSGRSGGNSNISKTGNWALKDTSTCLLTSSHTQQVGSLSCLPPSRPLSL